MVNGTQMTVLCKNLKRAGSGLNRLGKPEIHHTGLGMWLSGNNLFSICETLTLSSRPGKKNQKGDMSFSPTKV